MPEVTQFAGIVRGIEEFSVRAETIAVAVNRIENSSGLTQPASHITRLNILVLRANTVACAGLRIVHGPETAKFTQVVAGIQEFPFRTWTNRGQWRLRRQGRLRR